MPLSLSELNRYQSEMSYNQSRRDRAERVGYADGYRAAAYGNPGQLALLAARDLGDNAAEYRAGYARGHADATLGRPAESEELRRELALVGL